MIEGSTLSEGTKRRALEVFSRLAEAEGAVHGIPPQDVHFHEVGAVDSIVDIVGVAIGLEYLGVHKVTSAPLPLSRGFVHCQHGRLPLPAPATLELMRGLPVVSSGLSCELVTPTGAAIIAALAESFCDLPRFSLEAVGYGAGTRVLSDRPNLLRLMLGRAEQPEPSLLQVEVNLDDLSPEVLAYTVEQLFEAGARDVWVASIQMKKGRTGHLLGLLCERATLARMELILFRETSTLGFRYFPISRSTLQREAHVVETDFGAISVKVGRKGEEVTTAAPEYEDCRRAARAHQVPVKAVYAAALAAWQDRQG